jgi:hypothetical protein
MFSVTVAVRLSRDDHTPINVGFYPPIDEKDPQLEHYFNDSKLLNAQLSKQSIINTTLIADRTLLVFNAGITPHTANFTDDIVLYFIYDNVEFINNGLNRIRMQAQEQLFKDLEPHKRAYFWHL